jgi:hypothetical protein
MMPILNADGEKINWINYKTGYKGVQFKMEANNNEAIISIELSHKDVDIQQLYFEQFLELKKQLHNTLIEEWKWQLHLQNNQGRVISKIYKELFGVSVFKKEDWPQLIPFFKQRIIALDQFWSNYKFAFDALQ